VVGKVISVVVVWQAPGLQKYGNAPQLRCSHGRWVVQGCAGEGRVGVREVRPWWVPEIVVIWNNWEQKVYTAVVGNARWHRKVHRHSVGTGLPVGSAAWAGGGARVGSAGGVGSTPMVL